MITVTCPNCGASYRVSNEAAGESAKCATCGQPVAVPTPGAQPAGAAGASPPPPPPQPSVPVPPPPPGASVPAGAIDGGTPPAAMAQEEIPMARPASGGRWLLIGLVAAAVVLVGGGILCITFWPKPTRTKDPAARVNTLFAEAQELAADALDPNVASISALDPNALAKAQRGLPKAIAKYKELQEALEPLENRMATDAELRDLASAVESRLSMASRSLERVREEYWPRPGDPPTMATRVSSSVPVIVARKMGRSGSGFLINYEAGLGVVTNRHVVADCPHGMTLRFLTDSKSRKDHSVDIDVDPNAVRLIHLHEDVAVIRLSAEAGERLRERGMRPLKLARQVKVGSHVWVIGHPGAGQYGLLEKAYDEGYVSAVKEHSPGDAAFFRFTAPVNHGNSGGPVLDGDGRVIGVVSRGLMGKDEMNFAVHVHKLDELLGENSSAYSFNEEDIRRIVNPPAQLAADLEFEQRRLASQGYRRHDWSGRQKDAYTLLPAVKMALPGIPISPPAATKRFNAAKGTLYRVVVCCLNRGDVSFAVHAKGKKQPIYVSSGDGPEVAVKNGTVEVGTDFQVPADGTYEIVFVSRKVSTPLPICAALFERQPEEPKSGDGESGA